MVKGIEIRKITAKNSLIVRFVEEGKNQAVKDLGSLEKKLPRIKKRQYSEPK